MLASPFPDPLGKGRVGAEFLVTGDPYAVMRDLHAQVEERGLRPEVADWSGWEVCSESEHDGLSCSLYGRNEEDHVQFEAELQVVNPPMRGEGAPQRLLLFFGEDFRGSEWAEWIEAVPPEGQAPVQPAEIDAADLAPGAELPYYGFDEPLGEILDGAQMLAPSTTQARPMASTVSSLSPTTPRSKPSRTWPPKPPLANASPTATSLSAT